MLSNGLAVWVQSDAGVRLSVRKLADREDNMSFPGGASFVFFAKCSDGWRAFCANTLLPASHPRWWKHVGPP